MRFCEEEPCGFVWCVKNVRETIRGFNLKLRFSFKRVAVFDLDFGEIEETVFKLLFFLLWALGRDTLLVDGS
jgi:hypothetical protein